MKAARQEELRYFKKRGMWVLRPIDECIKETGRKPIPVRWVDHDKGTSECPDIRCRLVAKDFNKGPMEGVFAAMPLLRRNGCYIPYLLQGAGGAARSMC